jgi:hypothetical protein
MMIGSAPTVTSIVMEASHFYESLGFKGEIMKKYYLTVLFTFICLLGLGVGARAQEEDTIIAEVPYDFVAGGAVLPAGTYRVSRVDTGGTRELLIRSEETGAGAFVVPTVFAYAPGENAHLSLQLVGNKYFLTAIQTSNGVYTMAIPRSAVKLAEMDQHGTSSSGSN